MMSSPSATAPNTNTFSRKDSPVYMPRSRQTVSVAGDALAKYGNREAPEDSSSVLAEA